MSLTGEKVLFISPRFFNYEQHIRVALESFGAQVIFCNSNASENFIYKAIQRFYPYLAWWLNDLFWTKRYNFIFRHSYHRIFIIKGEGLTPRFLGNLRRRYPNAEIILYLYDSLSNCRGIDRKLKHMDFIYSFDPQDCLRHPSFHYRPLFYIDDYYRVHDPTGDPNALFFLGTLHGDRARVVCALDKQISGASRFDYLFYVRSKLELFIRRALESSVRDIPYDRFLYTSFSHSKLCGLLAEYGIVLDIEHPHQAGLTMRTFEVLAFGCKLVTTNSNVRNEGFFDQDRILILDRKFPAIPPEFIHTPVGPLPEQFFEKYSISGWIKEIFRIA